MLEGCSIGDGVGVAAGSWVADGACVGDSIGAVATTAGSATATAVGASAATAVFAGAAAGVGELRVQAAITIRAAAQAMASWSVWVILVGIGRS